MHGPGERMRSPVGVTVTRAGTGSPAPGAPILAVTDIVKRFGDGADALLAVDGVSLDVGEGEFVSVIGPSGCGKSTLFNIIGGLVADYDGAIAVDGESVSGTHAAFGMVFQDESAFPWRSVIDNVAFPLELAGVGKRERHERARRFVSMVGLDGFERRYPAELSGGMRQRVAIARTLASQPRILLMDEPFAALDEQTRLLLGDKVLQIHQHLRQTTLLITHNITEAVQLSDRVIVMTYRPGRLKRTFDIDLPRPRTDDTRETARYFELITAVRETLRGRAAGEAPGNVASAERTLAEGAVG